MRALLGGLLLALALASFYLGAACGMQRQVLYPRPPAGRTPQLQPPDAWVRPAGDGGPEAAFLPPRAAAATGAGAESAFPVVIFTHGNGELIDHWVGPFAQLRRAGIGVLLVEYPGYGRSPGAPTQASITRAVVDAYDFLLQQPGVDARRIVAWGRSLGGGAACALALERPLAALVLESTFTSVRAMAGRFGLPGPLVVDPFDNLAAVTSLDVPSLILHGEHDPLIPVEHGAALAAAGTAPLVRMPCGHNDCRDSFVHVLDFLRARGIARPAQG